MNKEKLLISAILFKYNVPIEEAKIVGTYIEQLENQNVAYKNMRKEAIEYTKSHFKEMVADEEAQILLNILNKVGGSDE